MKYVSTVKCPFHCCLSKYKLEYKLKKEYNAQCSYSELQIGDWVTYLEYLFICSQ